jgi:hypothetical protein
MMSACKQYNVTMMLSQAVEELLSKQGECNMDCLWKCFLTIRPSYSSAAIASTSDLTTGGIWYDWIDSLARSKLRHLDTVYVKGSIVEQRIYTYDARHQGALYEQPIGARVTKCPILIDP